MRFNHAFDDDMTQKYIKHVEMVLIMLPKKDAKFYLKNFVIIFRACVCGNNHGSYNAYICIINSIST